MFYQFLDKMFWFVYIFASVGLSFLYLINCLTYKFDIDMNKFTKLKIFKV